MSAQQACWRNATLAFAACGITGYALADLSYGRGQGGAMLAALLGRTANSGDAANTVSVVITNDEAIGRPPLIPIPAAPDT